MMLKDYSAPVRRLLYTATDPMASLDRSLAYTLFIQTCWQCEAATHAGLNIVYTANCLYVCIKKKVLKRDLFKETPILQVLIPISTLSHDHRFSLGPGVVLKVKCNFFTCEFFEYNLLIFRVHSWFGNDITSTAL